MNGVMWLGSAVVAACSWLSAVPVLWTLAVASAARGAGWAAVNTAGNALLARAAPPERRATASALMSLGQSASSTGAPLLAVWWLSGQGGGYTAVFGFAGLLGLGAVLLSLRIRRRVPDRAPAAPAEALPRAGSGSHRAMLRPAFLLTAAMFTQPALLSFVPLYAGSLRLGTAALMWFYGAFFTFAVAGRLLVAAYGDRIGRMALIGTGLVLNGVGLALLALTPGVVELALAAGLYSLGQSMTNPALTALAIDRADPGRQGAAMAVYSASFQLGMGVGALVAGALSDLLGYRAMFALMLVPVLAGLAGMRWRRG